MDIDKLEAGRELDVLVLKNVFGNEYKHIHNTDYYREGDDYVLIPFYSTDIAAAWKVVEKFDEYYIEHNATNYPDAKIFVMLGDNIDNAIEAETLPLAICRAALKALEI